MLANFYDGHRNTESDGNDPEDDDLAFVHRMKWK
jgi:hypothetical protein